MPMLLPWRLTALDEESGMLYNLFENCFWSRHVSATASVCLQLHLCVCNRVPEPRLIHAWPASGSRFDFELDSRWRFGVRPGGEVAACSSPFERCRCESVPSCCEWFLDPSVSVGVWVCGCVGVCVS